MFHVFLSVHSSIGFSSILIIDDLIFVCPSGIHRSFKPAFIDQQKNWITCPHMQSETFAKVWGDVCRLREWPKKSCLVCYHICFYKMIRREDKSLSKNWIKIWDIPVFIYCVDFKSTRVLSPMIAVLWLLNSMINFTNNDFGNSHRWTLNSFLNHF